MINGVELGCHEAPDSRNLLPLIHGRVKKLSPNIIVHHCIKCKGHVAIRQDDMKLINDNELYNITADPEEMKNLFENNEQYSILGKQMATRLQKIVERVDSREKITNIGLSLNSRLFTKWYIKKNIYIYFCVVLSASRCFS